MVVAGFADMLPDAPPLNKLEPFKVGLFNVSLTAQEFNVPLQLQLNTDELPRGIRVGSAVNEQVPPVGGITVQEEPTVVQVFVPAPPTITQESFWHSRWLCHVPKHAGSEPQVLVPGPETFTQAC